MARVEFTIVTPLPPERVISALTDFSDRRPEVWPGIHPGLYEVRSVGEVSAEVKEGSRAPGMTVWAIERYDWSVPGTVSWTIRESNLFDPGGSVSAQIDPRPSGGSRMHVTWNRTGVGLRGRMLVGMIKLSGGKPAAASIKAGLDKMRDQQPQSGKQADSSVYPVQARRRQ
jgi:Polyketide cyclase / dehydrase and lipid transport